SRRARAVRLAGDRRVYRAVEDDLSAEGVLPDRKRRAHQDGRRSVGRGSGHVARRRVARLEAVGRAPGIALVSGRALEAAKATPPSRTTLPTRAAGAGLLGLSRADDLLDPLLGRVSQRRRTKQRDHERGG